MSRHPPAAQPDRPAGWRRAAGGTSPDGAPVLTIRAIDLDRRSAEARGQQESVVIGWGPSRRARALLLGVLPLGLIGTVVLAWRGLWWTGAVVALLSIGAPLVVLAAGRVTTVTAASVAFARAGWRGRQRSPDPQRSPAEAHRRLPAPPDAGEGAERGIAVRSRHEEHEVLVRVADGWLAVARTGDPAAARTLAGWIRELGEPGTGR